LGEATSQNCEHANHYKSTLLAKLTAGIWKDFPELDRDLVKWLESGNGMGPGGLDSWDPILKGIVTWGKPIRIPNHRDPNHQLTIC